MTRKLLIIAIAISIHHATSYSFTPPRTSSSHPTIHIPKDDACIFSQKMTNQIRHSVKISDNLASLYNGGVNIVSHVSNYKRMSYWTMKKRLNAKQRAILSSNNSKDGTSANLQPYSTTTNDQDLEMLPQNLKRAVVAKRPFLGHVVPKDVRAQYKKSKNLTEGGTSNPKLRPQGQQRVQALNNPSNLKILGGIAKGRRLDSPDVYLRPMMGKVREAVYSTFTSFGLYDDKVAISHLDIFSGSGSVGLESLSRGAQHCTFVDLAQNCCDAVKRNIQLCHFGDDFDSHYFDDDDDDSPSSQKSTRIVCADAIQSLRNPISVGIPDGMTYDLITICPPYEEIVYADLLDAVTNSPLLTEDTVILIEYPVELGSLPHVLSRNDGGKLIGVRNRKYGRTVIAIYVANPTGRLDSSAESRPEEFIVL